MTKQNIYLIDYHSLSEGVHEFELPITEGLFVAESDGEVISGDGTINVMIDKKSEIAAMEVEIEGVVTVACDRCLEDCQLPISWQSKALVRITDDIDDIEEYDGGTVFLKTTDPYLDLTSYLYESIILSLPISRTHDNITDCNEDMIKHISQIITTE